MADFEISIGLIDPMIQQMFSIAGEIKVHGQTKMVKFPILINSCNELIFFYDLVRPRLRNNHIER